MKIPLHFPTQVLTCSGDKSFKVPTLLSALIKGSPSDFNCHITLYIINEILQHLITDTSSTTRKLFLLLAPGVWVAPFHHDYYFLYYLLNPKLKQALRDAEIVHIVKSENRADQACESCKTCIQVYIFCA